ncbi:MAG: helix-hairpin-helix domain-containing protein [Armatimonadetes bacterium]|nr:helix-hairpin-helix domain-containing protein [Armatimonadota bacterium]
MDFQSRSKLAVVLILVAGLLATGYTVFSHSRRLPGDFASVDIVELSEKPAAGSDPMPDLGSGMADNAASESASAASGAQTSEVVVHVAGMVKNPGVYRLAPGERVVDALKKAGGARDSADLDSINLAARPQDGEQIYVPKKGSAPPDSLVGLSPEGAAKSTVSSAIPPRLRAAHSLSGGSPSGSPSAHRVVNINTATAAELDTLPGVGPSTARSILEYRKAVGGFARVEDLINVKGIGEKKFAQMKPWVVVK